MQHQETPLRETEMTRLPGEAQSEIISCVLLLPL